MAAGRNSRGDRVGRGAQLCRTPSPCSGQPPPQQGPWHDLQGCALAFSAITHQHVAVLRGVVLIKSWYSGLKGGKRFAVSAQVSSSWGWARVGPVWSRVRRTPFPVLRPRPLLVFLHFWPIPTVFDRLQGVGTAPATHTDSPQHGLEACGRAPQTVPWHNSKQPRFGTLFHLLQVSKQRNCRQSWDMWGVHNRIRMAGWIYLPGHTKRFTVT